MVFFAQKVAHFVFFNYLCTRKSETCASLYESRLTPLFYQKTLKHARMLRTLHPQKIITFRIIKEN